MSTQKRMPQLSNIRSLAIILVTFGHSIILYSSSWDLYQTAMSVPALDAIKRGIDLIQMPLFFSLSGYLFVYTHQKKQGIFRLIKSKCLRLLIPYVGMGCLFLLPMKLAVGYPGYQNMGVGGFARKLLMSEDVGHLWFLPALFLMFLLSEVILSLAERIPGIKRFPAEFLLLAAFGLYLEGHRIGFGYPPVLGAYHYLLWFGAGYFLSVRQEVVRKIYDVRYIRWGMLAINAAFLAYYCRTTSVRVIVYLAIQALCIVNVYGAMPQRTCSVVEKIDRNSFGIYLFHSPLIYIVFSRIPNAHPAIVVFTNFILFGLVAFELTELVRKTKLRILIGEKL